MENETLTKFSKVFLKLLYFVKKKKKREKNKYFKMFLFSN